jgi:hypothetical protein
MGAPLQARSPITMDNLRSRPEFEREPPEALFHYTDFDGVAGILATRSLWLSKISTLNDTSEIHLAVEQFKARAAQAAERLAPDEALFLREAAAHLDDARRTYICVASFGEQDDQLEHWRSYANDGRGIALGFHASALREAGSVHDVRLLRCVYDREMHARIVDDLLQLLLQAVRAVRPRDAETRRTLVEDFRSVFLMTAPVIKDSHFAGESEWRLVSMPRSPDDPRLTAILSGNQASVKFVMPFCGDEPAPSMLLSSVTIGPTLDPDNVADAVDVLARRYGFDVPDVRYSQIPYRPRR